MCWPTIEWIRRQCPSRRQSHRWSSPGTSSTADVSAALADYVGDGAFLTRWNDYIDEPAAIDGDYVFEQAASDTPYQQVIYRTRDRGDITGLVLLAALASAVVAVVVVRGPTVRATLALDLD